MTDTPLVFDGHNDLLFHMHRGTTTLEQVRDGGAKGHIDVPRARQGGFAGGMFAIFVPGKVDGPAMFEAMQARTYDVPLPAPEPWAESTRVAASQAARLRGLERAGVLRICRSVDEIEKTMQSRALAAVMHMEGAEAIDPDLDMLELFHGAGLRSLGPVWSRPTIFGHGVPMRFPGDPDTGPGLTEAGERLVAACNRLGILIDLSHLNEKGFDDVARLSDAPLVATHSNAHALCPSPRNLTDRQLAQIAESGGVVGLNFAATFLRADGRMKADFGVDIMVDHLAYLVERLGENGVAIGSDYDGAIISADIGDVAGLPVLLEAMARRGFGEALVARIASGNWMRVLKATLRP